MQNVNESDYIHTYVRAYHHRNSDFTNKCVLYHFVSHFSIYKASRIPANGDAKN